MWAGNCSLYNIILTPSIASDYNGVWLGQNSEKRHLFRSSKRNWISFLRDCIHSIIDIPFDGFIYSGHGSAVSVGKWMPDQTPFFTIAELVQLFVDNGLYFPVMIWSACYMGSLLSLLECSRITNWVCADPGYAGWRGITETRSFWQRSGAIGPWLSRVLTEYRERYGHTDTYTCFMAFDVSYALPLFLEMINDSPMEWQWLENYPGDESTYDLLTVLEQTNRDRILGYLRKMMRYSPYTRGQKRGPSIQWGRYRGVENRYEGTIWWRGWQAINRQTVEFTYSK